MYRVMGVLLASLILTCVATSKPKADDLITKKSHHDVATTLDRLSTIVKEKGITVMARVDHAKNAEAVGMQLRPTQLLIFGNPKLGTKLMQLNQQIGLDLPMKVLAWQADDGQTWITYMDPKEIAEQYKIDEDDAVVKKLRKALDNFTTAAAAK